MALPVAWVLVVVPQRIVSGWVFRSFVLLVLVTAVMRALAVVTADHTGVAVRYRWITDRIGWQRRWAWPEVDGIYATEDGLTLVHRNRRSASQPMPWQAWTPRSTAVTTTFVEQVAVIAAAAGVPVRREKAPLWRPATAWRRAAASPSRGPGVVADPLWPMPPRDDG